MKSKKGLSLLLSLALFLSMASQAAAAITSPFSDVSAGTWYYEPVMQTAELGLMGGYGDGRFGPGDAVTRCQLVQVLYTRYGTDMGANSGFSDVSSGSWYAQAVTWAAKIGIVGGIGGDHFAPDSPLSRAQMAVILYGKAGRPAVNANAVLGGYTDYVDVPSWARDAFAWAVQSGIIGGISATTLAPNGVTTRAQVAVIMTRYLEKIDGVVLPEIPGEEEPVPPTPSAARNPDGTTNADYVNEVTAEFKGLIEGMNYPVKKDNAYPTKGAANEPNSNGFFTEANVDIEGATLEYAALAELNKILAELGKEPATWTTLDEAEEYTLMRVKEAYSSYSHDRPNGSNRMAAENLAVGYNTASTVMKGWKNSPEHYRLLKGAAGLEVCVAKYGSTWIITCWDEQFAKPYVIQCASNNYNF